MTLNDLYTSFKVTSFFDAEYPRNGTCDLHTSYSTVSFRMTLSDLKGEFNLEKYMA